MTSSQKKTAKAAPKVTAPVEPKESVFKKNIMLAGKVYIAGKRYVLDEETKKDFKDKGFLY